MIKERLEENKEFQHLKPKDNGKLQWNYHVKESNIPIDLLFHHEINQFKNKERILGKHPNPIIFRYFDKGPKAGTVVFYFEGRDDMIESKISTLCRINYYCFLKETPAKCKEDPSEIEFIFNKRDRNCFVFNTSFNRNKQLNDINHSSKFSSISNKIDEDDSISNLSRDDPYGDQALEFNSANKQSRKIDTSKLIIQIQKEHNGKKKYVIRSSQKIKDIISKSNESNKGFYESPRRSIYEPKRDSKLFNIQINFNKNYNSVGSSKESFKKLSKNADIDYVINPKINDLTISSPKKLLNNRAFATERNSMTSSYMNRKFYGSQWYLDKNSWLKSMLTHKHK